LSVGGRGLNKLGHCVFLLDVEVFMNR
jgi:hypothetical protein